MNLIIIKGGYKMYCAEFLSINGATYRFCSYDFKWVYRQALSFAKRMIYKWDDQKGIDFVILDGDENELYLIWVSENLIEIDIADVFYWIRRGTI